MMIIRPPQHGHGRGNTDGSLGGAGLAASGCFGGIGEQLASACDVGGAVAVGEQAIVSDAMEALGQHVDQEATDELVGRQRHRLVAARSLDPIVLVLEGDAGLIDCDQAMIRDGDAVGVA